MTNRIRQNVGEYKRNLYYKLPKYLLLDPEYKGLSATAKIAYSVLLDRHRLSVRNGWVDKKGDIYLIMSRVELQELVGVSKDTATKIMNDLKRIGLIEEKRRGQGYTNLIYMLIPKNPDFTWADDDSRILKNSAQDSDYDAVKDPILLKPRPLNSGIPSFNKNYISDIEREGEEKPDASPPTPPNSEKDPYGDDAFWFGEYGNVFMRHSEYEKLLNTFGDKNLVREYMHRLDEHIESTGKRYKSQSATISKWIKEDRRKSKKDEKTKPSRFANFTQRDNKSKNQLLELLRRVKMMQEEGIVIPSSLTEEIKRLQAAENM